MHRPINVKSNDYILHIYINYLKPDNETSMNIMNVTTFTTAYSQQYVIYYTHCQLNTYALQ
jgi:hypothetical protein